MTMSNENEVWVGNDAPADPAVELWFDPDAVMLQDGTIRKVHTMPDGAVITYYTDHRGNVLPDYEETP